MLRLFTLIFLISTYGYSFSQTLKVKLEGVHNTDTLTIQAFRGYKTYDVFKKTFTSDTIFKLELPYKKGFYRIMFKSKKEDVIISKSKTTANINIEKKTISIDDPENNLLSDTKKQWDTVTNKKRYILRLREDHPKSYFVKTFIANFSPTYYMDDTSTISEFSNIPFEDSSIVYSTLIPKRILQSLSKHPPKNTTYFKSWIDNIINMSSINKFVNEYTISFIADILPEISPEEVNNYFSEKYLSKVFCNIALEEIDTNTNNLYHLYNRGNYKNLQLPKPNIFEKIDSSFTQHLVLIWSNQCPHCKDAIHFLKNNNDLLTQKNIEVILLDIENESLNNDIRYKNWSFYNNSDSFWDPFIKAINLNATPTYFFIDSNDLILKPNDIFDFFSIISS